MLENVREFADWGPLLPAFRCQECGWRGTEGQAKLARTRRRCPRCNSLRLKQTDKWLVNPDKKGLTFKRWVGRLRNLGYAIQWKNLDAADFGAPTHRRRLFLIARCDGRPIEWPEHTHGNPLKLNDMPLFSKLSPWRTAADCIDWSVPCPSIFDRVRPLADNSLRRVAFGLKRYVLESPEPFIVGVGGRAGQSPPTAIDAPVGTVTSKNDRALVTPYLTRICQTGGHGNYANGIEQPLTTIVSKQEHCLVSPTLITVGYGERDGQRPRVPGLEKPLGAVVAGGQKHALVAAMLAKFYGGVLGHGVDRPLGTVTSIDHHALVTAYLARFSHGEKQWNDVREPLCTVTSQGNKFGLVYAFMTKYYGTSIGQELHSSLGTVTANQHFALVLVRLESGEVEPAVVIDVPGIGLMAIADIGLRMLTPRELARAQGFPDTYILTGPVYNQVARIGNSVCPVMPQRIIEANYVPQMITT